MPRNLNPLYTALLEEWKREMEEKNPESHIVTAIGKAIASLGKSTQVYLNPWVIIQALPLEHGCLTLVV